MSRVVLRHYQASASVLIQSMDDTWSGDAADTAKLAPAMMQESVDQCMVIVPSGWMHHQPCRLVEHDQVVVFEEDLKRYSLRFRFCAPRLRPANGDHFASAW